LSATAALYRLRRRLRRRLNWTDAEYLSRRAGRGPAPQPDVIYEVILGSLAPGRGTIRFLTYDELADSLIPYARDHGFTISIAADFRSIRSTPSLATSDRPVRADLAFPATRGLQALSSIAPMLKTMASSSIGCRRIFPRRTWAAWFDAAPFMNSRPAPGVSSRLADRDL